MFTIIAFILAIINIIFVGYVFVILKKINNKNDFIKEVENVKAFKDFFNSNHIDF